MATLSLVLVAVSLSMLFAQEDDLEEYKLTATELTGYEKLENTQCIGVDGYDADLVRDYVGNVKECKALCDTYDNCAGFIRVNGPKSSPFYGKCYLRADGIGTIHPVDPVTGDDRDCYRSIRYIRSKGQQCTGTEDDILRDYEGNALKCGKKCDSMDDCVGFVRVKVGSQYAGKCYFRGGSLNPPEPYKDDKRSCFAPDPRIRKSPSGGNQMYGDDVEDEYEYEYGINADMGNKNFKLTSTALMGYEKLENTQCIGVDGYDADLVRDYVGNVKECKALCDTYDNCAGFIRVNGPVTSPFYGKCYLRADGIGVIHPVDPVTGDDRDCYRSVRYIRSKGDTCTGTGADLLTDYRGTAKKCAIECDNLDGCVGFVRVKAGSLKRNKCDFRSGSLNTPTPYTGDRRSCFSPDPRIKKEASDGDQIYVDEYEYMVNHGSVDGLLNNGNYNNIQSMIIYVLFGVFIGLMALYGCKAVLRLNAKWRSSKTREYATDTTPLIQNGEIKV